MEPTFWQWIAIVAVVAAISLKLGAMFGRGASEAERTRPIPTTRISPEARAKIEDALRRKRKVEAVKLLRQDAGCTLAEAKKTVEALEAPRLG